jgi:AAA domain
MIPTPIHCLVYGESGTKKSTFAASFPTPMLVFFFDPLGKDGPYLRRGEPTGLIPSQFDNFPAQEVYEIDPTQQEGVGLLMRLEYFPDPLPTKPRGYATFLTRFAQVQSHVFGVRPIEGEPAWKTIVFDSATFMELAARKYAQYVLDPTSKDPRRWYGASKEQLEETLLIAAGSLAVNIVTICHVDEDKDEAGGFMVRNPSLPGKLRKAMASGYGEFYHSYITATDKGAVAYHLQTQGNQLFNAGSQILAPNNCPPQYQALWEQK